MTPWTFIGSIATWSFEMTNPRYSTSFCSNLHFSGLRNRLHLRGVVRIWQTVHWCRRENGSMCIPPMETSFSHWNMSLLSQVENPILGRIFAGNPNIRFFRCLPNRDVISSSNPPNSHDQNGGTYVRIGGLLKEK